MRGGTPSPLLQHLSPSVTSGHARHGPRSKRSFTTQRAAQAAEQPVCEDGLASLPRERGGAKKRPQAWLSPHRPPSCRRPRRERGGRRGRGRSPQGRAAALAGPGSSRSGGDKKIKIPHSRGKRGEREAGHGPPRRSEGRPGAAEGEPLRAATAAGRAVPPLRAREKGLRSSSPPWRSGGAAGPAAQGPAPRTGGRSPVSPQCRPAPPPRRPGAAARPPALALSPSSSLLSPSPPSPHLSPAAPGASERQGGPGGAGAAPGRRSHPHDGGPRPAALTLNTRPGSGVGQRPPPLSRHWGDRDTAARGVAVPHVN